MNNSLKGCPVAILFILLASSIFAIIPISAESIPNPSVPEFTVKIIDHSYDTPVTTPTYTTDPYTGEQIQLTSGSPSYHIQNKSIEISIKNQPFTAYISSGNYIGLYYNFRYKGHYGTDWTYDPFKPNDISSKMYGGWDMTRLFPYEASKSDYTIVSKTFDYFGANYGQVDFQVQAQIGYVQEMGSAYSARIWGNFYNFTGQSSDWSNTQTITIDTSNPTINPTAPIVTFSPAPYETDITTQLSDNWALPQLDLNVLGFAALASVVVVLLVFLVLLRKRIRVLELKQNGT